MLYPTITCPSTTVTGVVITPSFSRSPSAAASVVMSRSTNETSCWQRNSFTRLQNSQPGCENSVTLSAIHSLALVSQLPLLRAARSS